MTRLRLYTGPLSMFGAKAEIALLEKGVDFDRIAVPFTDDDRYQPKHAEVVRINPKGQVPVVVHRDVEVFDSTQIFEYLEDAFPAPPLWPATPAKRAEARQLELKSDEVFFPHIIKLMGLEATPDDPAAIGARTAASRFYDEMDARLATRQHLAGEFTYADIAFFMAQLFGERKGAVMAAATPRLLAWRTRMLERPAVKHVTGEMSAWLESHGRPVPQYLLGLLQDG
jgi:glutathione S-transferase